MALLSRSAIDTRLQCEMKRWWGYEMGGTGLALKNPLAPTYTGQGLHDVMKVAVKGSLEDVKEAVEVYTEQLRKDLEGKEPPSPFYVKEQRSLVGGLAYGWRHFRLPMILEEYDVVSQEETFMVDVLGIGEKMPFRMDVVLRRKDSGALVVLDFKTTKTLSDSWFQQWNHDPQTFIYIEALQQYSGEVVEGIIYEPLVKGLRKVDSAAGSAFNGYEIQYSPLCYGYQNKSDGEVKVEWPGSYKNWNKVVSSQVVGGQWWRWVDEHVPVDVLYDQFGTTGLVSPADWVRREMMSNMKMGELGFREKLDLFETEGANPNKVFVRNPHQCLKYGTNYRCSFYELCWTSSGVENMQDMYEARVPHHNEEE